jgi:hypothetical protein
MPSDIVEFMPFPDAQVPAVRSDVTSVRQTSFVSYMLNVGET